MMKLLNIVLALVVCISITSCGSTQNAAVDSASAAKLDSVINKKEFRIDCQWAMPTISSSMMRVANSGLIPPGNNVQRIDIIDDGAFIQIKGDSAKADLPFFGERQMGGGYNTEGEGIKFNNKITDLEIEYLDKKKHHRITFSTNNSTETFDVTLMVFLNGKTSVSVNSSERDFITYDGMLKELPKKE
ncbi:DUF4251 domain-containing protein [Galbibacter mesophilus]|uniref:DUF4251 domain-containing protein n=1 Tax=Galbibacter mesophilus TaxID=379069 RepID=UPI00191E13C4|nr:DUF4251 domain-containing protein [Galbibacter mesophilus]MCM5663150.1 DUF4251 domain-containing protein [Galbibacter mesophilus]